jgi:hypothetical protein
MMIIQDNILLKAVYQILGWMGGDKFEDCAEALVSKHPSRMPSFPSHDSCVKHVGVMGSLEHSVNTRTFARVQRLTVSTNGYKTSAEGRHPHPRSRQGCYGG